MVGTVLWLGGWTLSLVLGYYVVRQRRTPTATIAWLSVVLAFPYVGALAYLLIGTRKRPQATRRLRLPAGFESDLPTVPSDIEDFFNRQGMLPASENVYILHVEAKVAREALLSLIESAEREIFLLVYTFAYDQSGRQVLEALGAAAKRGVKVRLMVDDLGSWFLRTRNLALLQQPGVEVARFKPVWYFLSKRLANLRNHRKIAVADGMHAWTGGRNIADVYLADHSEQSTWADLSLSVTGPAAAVLEEICRNDWAFATNEKLPTAKAVAAPELDAQNWERLQVLISGPEQRGDHWHASLLKAFMTCRTRIWLMTPYFVPDEALMHALSIAARSGADVRIIVPRRSDNIVVDMVGTSYLRELARHGVKVMRYQAGMLHTKSVIIDDLGVIGSANFDARSFFLNYEVALFAYRGVLVEELASYFVKCEARSVNGLRALSGWREALSGCARALAPML